LIRRGQYRGSRDGNNPEILMFQILRYLSKYLSQEPLRAVSLYRSSDTLTGHKAKTSGSILLTAVEIKHNRVIANYFRALPVGLPELPILPKHLQGHYPDSPVKRCQELPEQNQADSFFLPLLRLLLRICLPARVLILLRKPWSRARFISLG
jgi:hypothetical protein